MFLGLQNSCCWVVNTCSGGGDPCALDAMMTRLFNLRYVCLGCHLTAADRNVMHGTFLCTCCAAVLHFVLHDAALLHTVNAITISARRNLDTIEQILRSDVNDI